MLRISKRRLLISVAVATLAIAPVGVWGMSKIISSDDDSIAIACNPNATNIGNAVCLQDMNDNVKASMAAETQYTLKDSRDGKSYYISKLNDGNVWMTQNLDLGSSSSTTALSAMDTDISASSTFMLLPKAEFCADHDCAYHQFDYSLNVADMVDYGDKYSISQWNDVSIDDYLNSLYIGYFEQGNPPWTTRHILSTLNGRTNRIVDTGDKHYHVGNEYRRKVALARVGGEETDTVTDSICPAGWQLPSSSIYEGLVSEYDSVVEVSVPDYTEEASTPTAQISVYLANLLIRRNPLYFVGGNRISDGVELGLQNDVGKYIAADGRLEFGNDITGSPGSIIARSDDSLTIGFVRCIARPDSSFTHTLSYNVNGGNGTVASSTVNSSHKQVETTVSNTEPTRANYDFMGWAESSDATTAKYHGGDTMALAGNKTLYAVWKIALPDQTVSFAETSVTKTYGDESFTNTATANGGGAITYSSDNTVVATVNSSTGAVTIKGAGTATITATAAATTEYSEGSATYTLTVKKANRTVSFSDVTVNKKYGDANFTKTATRTGDGDIVYSSSNTDVAEVNSSTGEITIKGVGAATITASVAATDNYKAGSASYILNVAKGSSSVSFANVTVTKTYGDANFTNTATASNDGTIAYSSDNTAVATVNSSTGAVTIKGAGTATITASVAATTNYAAASATYSLTVNKANRTVSFANTTITKTYGDAAFTNAATRTGDGNIVYGSSNTNVAEVNSSTGKVTIKGAGTATITANVAATDNYKAGSATYTLTISKATPTVAFANTSVSKSYLDAKFTNVATTNSNGTISYSSNNTAVATVNSTSGEVTIKGAGTATITASVAATNNYNTASATYTLTVGRYAPTITFANTTVTKTYGDANFTNAATTISDGTISYSSNNTVVATVNSTSGEVTIKGAGTTTITANVSATTNHQAATTTYALTVNKKTSTAPEEVSEVKTGYVTDQLSTIALNTTGLVWDDDMTRIEEGHNGYAVSYTENGDPANYTTETFEITVNGERRVYKVTGGDGQTYILKSDQYTSFRLDADYSLFEEGGSVYIDDVLLDSQYYTAESGSTIISVSNNYLETLPVGDHTLSVYFSDGGVATATFAVAELTEEEKNSIPVPNTASATTGTPNTGSVTDDERGLGADLLVYALPIGMLVAMFMGGYIYRNKKANRKFEW